MIRIKIAGIPIAIDNRFKYLERHCADYLTDEAPCFTVSVSDADLAAERALSEQDFNDGYLESIAVYRKIAERLYEYDAFVFHGAVLNYRGRAYAFTARSGVGKTTHTRLWLSAFGDDAHYLNGDKPIIRIIDGTPYACGTPWRGKEKYGVNEMTPLSGIALVSRSQVNSAQRVDPSVAAVKMVTQIFMPSAEPAVKHTMRLINSVMHSVRFVELYCNMDISAAYTARDALAGDS